MTGVPVSDAPLSKPDHLSPQRGEWLAAHAASAAALALGVLAFVVVAVTQSHVWATPDWRISVPGLALTAVAVIASFARREKSYGVALAGLGFAGAAAVLGWFLMLAIVVGVIALVILILHALM